MKYTILSFQTQNFIWGIWAYLLSVKSFVLRDIEL